MLCKEEAIQEFCFVIFWIILQDVKAFDRLSLFDLGLHPILIEQQQPNYFHDRQPRVAK